MDSRQAQLREAKRRQRQRERETGLGLYQIRLPMQALQKLKKGMSDEKFITRLQRFIATEVLTASDFPQLKLLCWNRHDDTSPGRMHSHSMKGTGGLSMKTRLMTARRS